MAGPTVLSGQLIATPDGRLVHQTTGLEHLLRILAGEPGNYTRYVPARDRLPSPVQMLLRQITGAANSSANSPPRAQVTTAYGVVTLEAKWLMPANSIPTDVAKDPKSCLIAVTIELREHALAHAARILRESGATPAQMKVGIQLALGKTKPMIADALGIDTHRSQVSPKNSIRPSTFTIPPSSPPKFGSAKGLAKRTDPLCPVRPSRS